MNFKVETVPEFERSFSKLAKKYPSLISELATLVDQLQTNPTIGTSIGQDCYKIRLAVKSKNKGKSGGARVITYLKVVFETVYLVAVYSKGDQDNISPKEIAAILKESGLQ